MSSTKIKNQVNSSHQNLSLAGVVVSMIIVILCFLFCLFKDLPLLVVWTALGFHVTYQILFWNKKVRASAKGLEISNEDKSE